MYSAQQRRAYTEAIHRYTATDPRWAARSAAFRAKMGNRCQACGVHGRMDAHHIRYDLSRPGLEPDSWLRCLCRRCHIDGVHTLARSGIPLERATDMVMRHGGPVSTQTAKARHSVRVSGLALVLLSAAGFAAWVWSYLGR